MTETKKHRVWKEPAFIVGVALTVGISAIFAYSLFCLPVITEERSYFSKWAYLKSAPPNEIGDTLAGVAGSFAFVWIVVTVWLQATELREQRTEFEKMAIAQDKQADLLKQQGEIFLDEQNQRAEERAREKLEEQMLSFVRFVEQHPSVNWKFNRKRADGTGYSGQHSLIPWGLNGKTVDEKVMSFSTWLSETSAALQSDWASNNLMSPDDFPEAPLKGYGLKEELEKLIGTKQLLSESQQIRFERLGIETALHFLKEIHGLPVWKEVPVDPQLKGQS